MGSRTSIVSRFTNRNKTEGVDADGLRRTTMTSRKSRARRKRSASGRSD